MEFIVVAKHNYHSFDSILKDIEVWFAIRETSRGFYLVLRIAIWRTVDASFSIGCNL